MTIDLKYLIPAVLPFILLIIARLVFLVAGAEWSDPAAAAVIFLGIGLLLGAFIVSMMILEEKKWEIKLW